MSSQKRKVFVSGVFDILHFGHIDFLQKAKNLVGEDGILIIAVHDDVSVREKKGRARPIHGLNERVKVLEAIKYVDEVIPWIGWENVSELVEKIKPDYIAVSGEEYKRKSIGSIAKKVGAELKTFPKIPELSTTKIINDL